MLQLAYPLPAGQVSPAFTELTNKFRNNGRPTPVVVRAGYKRWQKGIANGFLVDKSIACETIVDTGPVSRALAYAKASSLRQP